MLPNLTETLHHTTYAAISPNKPIHSAEGKTVIVSGGGGGIGYGIAKGFCEAGASAVIILARRQESLDEALRNLGAENVTAGRSTQVWTYLLDIRNSTATRCIFRSIRNRLNDNSNGEKDADILVANAAVLSQGKTTLDFDIEEYRNAFDTNVIGNLNLVQAFLEPEAPALPFTNFKGEVKALSPLRHPAREKVILDVSTSASFFTIRGQASYSASKLAFTRALRVLHAELCQLEGAPIRIHSFNPGMVWTPGTSKVMSPGTKFIPWDDVSLPSHFAVWLASPAAAFTSGRFLSANWDVEEIVALKDRFDKDADFCTITLKL